MNETKTKTTTPRGQQLAIRLEAELLERLDAHTARLRTRLPGLRVTRAGALRDALLAGLERLESAETNA